jgi:hypothetical protein
MTERRQRVEGGAHFEDHVAAAPAVAPVGSAARDVFLAAEVDHAIPALAGFNFDFCLIYEHGSIINGTRFNMSPHL